MPFLGRAVVERQLAEGAKKRLATFTVADPAVILLGRETIYRDGERVGWLSSGGHGHTLGLPIGLGYVRQPGPVTDAFLASGSWELEVAAERVPCRLHMAPLYDPAAARVRA